MKKIITIVMATVLMSLVMTSCKTSEENYKAAYDIAASKQRSGVDNKVSAFIEREKRLGEVRVVSGDSIRFTSQYVSPLDEENTEIHKYGIVVGDFKQKFNATSYRNRINNETGENTAYIVVGQDKNYMVIYKGFDTKEEAAEFMKDKSNFKITIPKTGMWILERMDK